MLRATDFNFAMKSLFVRSCGPVAGLLLFLGSSSALRAADVMDDLEGFRKKLSDAETKTSSDPRLGGYQFSTAIRQLESVIKHGDDDRAIQTLENLGGEAIPSQFQDEWQHLSTALIAELEKRKASRLEKTAATIDQLVQDTHKTCLEAKTSDDLDTLLLRCSNLQMQVTRGNTVVNERFTRKLQGIAQTLTNWTSYLDFQKAGNVQRANTTLRELINDHSSYPVLSLQEIEARLSESTGPTDVHTAITRVFADVNSADNLPSALKRLESYSNNPQNQDLQSLKMETQRMNAYIDAWQSAKAGDTANAMSLLNRTQGGLEEAQRYYTPIKEQIEARIMQDKVAAWTKLTRNPNESSRAYLGRILDDLQTQGDYTKMLDVAAFTAQVDRSTPALVSSSDREAIEQFLAGQRFEKAGDGLAAINSYRVVVGLPAGKYAPTDQATEALKTLQTKYPEAFKNYEGVVLEQLRGISQQLQLLQRNRPPGYPFRP